MEDNSQNWAGMDGAIAWHLIERHAEGWGDIGKMMDGMAQGQCAPDLESTHEMSTSAAWRGDHVCIGLRGFGFSRYCTGSMQTWRKHDKTVR